MFKALGYLFASGEKAWLVNSAGAGCASTIWDIFLSLSYKTTLV